MEVIDLSLWITCLTSNTGHVGSNISTFSNIKSPHKMAVVCHFVSSDRTFINGIFEPLLIYLFAVLHRFQHSTGHITTGSLEGQRKPVHSVHQGSIL